MAAGRKGEYKQAVVYLQEWYQVYKGVLSFSFELGVALF